MSLFLDGAERAASENPELESTVQRRGRASQCDVPATERLSRYCPHGDRGMQNAPEEASLGPVPESNTMGSDGEGVTAGRDPQLFDEVAR